METTHGAMDNCLILQISEMRRKSSSWLLEHKAVCWSSRPRCLNSIIRWCAGKQRSYRRADWHYSSAHVMYVFSAQYLDEIIFYSVQPCRIDLSSVISISRQKMTVTICTCLMASTASLGKWRNTFTSQNDRNVFTKRNSTTHSFLLWLTLIFRKYR